MTPRQLRDSANGPWEETVVATLLDPRRGYSVAVTEQGKPEHAEGIEFRWTEGNESCDCNRRLYIARKLGEPDPEPNPCGKEVALLGLTLGDADLLASL